MLSKEEFWHYYEISALIVAAFFCPAMKKYNDLFFGEYPNGSMAFVISLVLIIIIYIIIGVSKKQSADYIRFAARIVFTVMILEGIVVYIFYG